MNKHLAKPIPAIRCAIYTRKSTEEGLEQEFNSLDNQRESAEAYIKSQANEGWQCLPTKYDDGGYTGGNMERPAIKRLLDDIAAGQIDCVIVYKVDRLSRSLLDFARMMEVFDRHNVSFVSVTQQFNTTHSMGRLTLNILLSFAQFEREIISERTRDKIAATRRKGKWSGGQPVLGYDVDAATTKLVVNEPEARRVRSIFQLYAQNEALIPVVQELAKRGWCNKSWVTKKGINKGGHAFTKTSLHGLLTNPIYIGRVRYKQETHPGEHKALVDEVLWQRAQAILARNAANGGTTVRNRSGSLLKGLLRCVPCSAAMTPAHSVRNGNKRYRYYCCIQAQKKGWNACPSKSIPAAEIEQFVVERIRDIGRDPELVQEVIEQVTHQQKERQAELGDEEKLITRELKRWEAEIKNLVGQIKKGDRNSAAALRLAELEQRFEQETARLAAIRSEMTDHEKQTIEDEQITKALADFDTLWTAMVPHEQVRLIHLLIERIDYDGKQGQVSITFHATGLQTFLANSEQKESA
jgi:site-specific DNA recombinase